ncbi:hypothetical protein KC19_VG133000 [Ceratodon purpureus]|uniref:Uncharacterized protein n=1 Tax=Ceratodon purpureus TaxID=3225 RepID=A0A8T0HQ80_CERPU|nr:hypothetical protein KC19_VG133000 [Ceratodon purpureus]
MQSQLDANTSGMASMERKLDMVLEMHASLIRSSTGKELLPYKSNCSNGTEGNERERISATPHITTTGAWETPLACEKTYSGSGPSADLCGHEVIHIGPGCIPCTENANPMPHLPPCRSTLVGPSMSTQNKLTLNRKRPSALEMAFGSFEDPMLSQKPTPTSSAVALEENIDRPSTQKVPKKRPASTRGVDEIKVRTKRKVNKPSRYLTYIPLIENKPRSEKCEQLKPKKNVWILHPDYPNETIAIGKSGPSWRSNKKVWIPNVSNVS